MIKNIPFPVIAVVVFCNILLSCKKQDHAEDLTNREPPKLQASSIYPVVGSDIDSLTLSSSPIYNYEPGERPYAPKWETEWACTMKPSGAPDPLIAKKTEKTAYATNLVPGTYRFEVSYRTKVSTRKAYFDVTVVQAKQSGTSIILDRVDWQISEGGEFSWSWVLYGSLPNDPEHFYYSGEMRGPKVEYMDPITNQWKQLAQTDADSAFATNGRAAINFPNSSLWINVWNGITPDLLPIIIAKPPAVRLTYP